MANVNLNMIRKYRTPLFTIDHRPINLYLNNKLNLLSSAYVVYTVQRPHFFGINLDKRTSQGLPIKQETIQRETKWMIR
jgi:hypothetical protein